MYNVHELRISFKPKILFSLLFLKDNLQNLIKLSFLHNLINLKYIFLIRQKTYVKLII